MENKRLDRIGEVCKNTFGSNMKIVEYYNARHIKIQFDNGYEKYCAYPDFKKGLVKSPYERRLCNIGFLGEGKYKQSINRKHTKVCSYWSSMIQRCYNENNLKNRPTYKDCSVCEEWHNFQNFAKWFDENFYQIDNETMCLDKDILHKGNKIYSPENCIFMPDTINSLLVKCNKARGNLPIGVSLTKNKDRYRVEFTNIINNIKTSKVFDTIEETFEHYKEYKEKHIKYIANKYKNKIPQILYDTLINYQVEITD